MGQFLLGCHFLSLFDHFILNLTEALFSLFNLVLIFGSNNHRFAISYFIKFLFKELINVFIDLGFHVFYFRDSLFIIELVFRRLFRKLLFFTWNCRLNSSIYCSSTLLLCLLFVFNFLFLVNYRGEWLFLLFLKWFHFIIYLIL